MSTSIEGDSWEVVTAGEKAWNIGKWRKYKKEKHSSRKRERKTEKNNEDKRS